MIEITENEVYDTFEEGGWCIRKNNDQWDLFQLPQYGGYERFIKSFPNNDLDKAIALAKTFT